MGLLGIIFIILGTVLVAYSIYYYMADCRGNVSASMGADMSFNAFWIPGLLLLSLGLFPHIGLSRWWTGASVVAGFALSFPVRKIIAAWVCVPYEPEPTGFQMFVRKVEGTDDAHKPPDND